MSLIKPFFIACLILVSLFTAGAMNCRTITNLTDSMGKELSVSSDAAEQAHWSDAYAALHRAGKTWQEHSAYLHVMVDHSDIDEAEALFAEIKQYAAQQDSDRYTACAAQLAVRLDQLRETQQLSVKNIL